MPRHDLTAERKREGRGGGLRERENTEYGRLIHLGHCPPYRWVTCHRTVNIIREGQRDRETDRQTDRQTDRPPDRQTDRQRQRETERDRDTNRESTNREDS